MSEFKRYTIIGFDLRKKPLLDLGGHKQLADYWPTDFPQPFPYPATISPQTWLQSKAVEAMKYPETNGVNLFFLPDLARLDLDAVSVAFSMRARDADIFLEKSWILPIDEAFLSAARGWRLLGWDVADDFLGHSAFYGFTWKPGQLTEVLMDVDLRFNRHGLLDDEEVALQVAEKFTSDPGTKGHGQFYAVRVWVQV